MQTRTRAALCWCVALGAAGLAGTTAADADADALFQRIAGEAQALAGQAYSSDEGALPETLDKLDYQAYRDIRFRKDHALWAGQANFNAEFFHPGFLYRQPVDVFEVADGEIRRVAFDTGSFDYGKNYQLGELPADLGFAGFRLHFPLHNAQYKDELVAFLGASYFRIVGREQHYGLSARGLAVDTAVPTGEEFPRFRSFYLVRPEPDSNRLTFYALLDSPSVTGAYQFQLESDAATVVDVRMQLFARAAVTRLGIAPLTSMFAWGENSVRRFDDYRPEVHDSDGLLQHTGSDEWIFRPLVNPPQLQTTALLDRAPRGFGLVQRDRDFDNYQDAEAQYDRRPGIWITPGAGDWGSGAVQLVEIPTPDETNDNIVAFWVSDQPFEAGATRRFEYRMRTVADLPEGHGLAMVAATRNGWGWNPGTENQPPRTRRQFVVDFTGGELAGLADNQPIDANLSVQRGKVRDVTVSKLPGSDTWRVAFKLNPDAADRPVDMRLFLELRGQRLSETWTYLWHPASVVSS